ncbi:MAG TPA: hypothetical protein VGP68_20920, partial [Gemmataceae bacterium]|nr:hypothetical protein [Gemmataceae bacterium]
MSSPKPEDRNHSGKSEKMDLAPVAPASFRRSGFIERWRFWSPALLVFAFVLWRGADLWMQDFPGRKWHTPGHLAVAHGVYEDQCTVCHEAYSPVSASNWVAAGLGRTHAADSKCTECHESSNHHAKEKPDRRPACTACHWEHRGRTTSLVQAPDGQCTNCHAELSKNLAENASSKLSNVARFDKDNHPEFQISQNTATDPRRLKFNHKLHLTPGMRTAAEGEAFTLNMVDPRYRSLYGPDAGPGQAVRLECKSCHQLDSRDFAPAPDVLSDVPRNAVMPARPPGA